MSRIRDFSKTKIGKIQPLYIDKDRPRKKGENIYWICQCDCGNIVSINSSNLRSGERVGRNMFCGKCHAQLQDLSNKKFGKLTVLRHDDSIISCKSNHYKNQWICQCECGNIISVIGNNLIRGHTTSCGCASRSIGEENIESILKKNQITYQKEYSFLDLKDKEKLRFDFAIFNKNNTLSHLIEFDGRQHYLKYSAWDSKETLLQRQKRDQMKNDYCQKHNIKLIRIPYTKRDNITLQMLGVDINEFK